MANEILVTRGLTKRYGNHLAVDHVELSIQKGQIYGLVGRNGAGKTTIIRMVTAQTVPTEGEVSLFGASGERELSKMRARTGAMVETPSFYPYLTARQNLEYYRIQRGIPGRSCVDEALELVRLTGAGKKKFKTFSLGMKQRLGIAIALAGDPDLLVLDEPVNGLDPQGIVEIRELILKLNRERRITVLISSHILDELSRLATHYGIIDHGRMVKELSAEELDAACRKCIRMEVSDTGILARVLDSMHLEYRITSETTADLFAKPSVTQLAVSLAEEGCEVLSMTEKDESLESYYLSLIGGGNHD